MCAHDRFIRSARQTLGLEMPKELLEQVDQALIRLLAHRYGDGLVYLRDDGEQSLFQRAVNMGLVNREGYLTPAGRSLVARFNND